ncbi:LysR family transcriptional regulator [Candidimonas sp. SYP-B2681]|uniref:LysR family transcriptional regulator n=1 Tax=Candidimonas sp. SYP-B2681 TaxID=2497686 RepID=UPI000F88B324|nr:LysR family transcriptional regulator [Candidimonas sp. SYP-B2681]RTZ47991.1 LysR family transcriptional regulator [Candidimonas sp. SYP-B2681]
MDPVSDLNFFVLLSKYSTLARAAQELGVTPPTVSKRLAALEQRLGVRLMNRTTRRIGLTAEGEAYLTEGARLLAELNVLEQTVAGSQAVPRGLLRVHATLGFGRRHIVPAVSRFIRIHPETEVQLHLSDRPVNLVEQGIDVAIRFGDIPDSRLTMRTIAFNRRLLCASPHYLKQAGEPAHPGELPSHDCIIIRENDETYGTWHLAQGTRIETVKVRGRVSTNDGESALAWALDGHGILLRSEWDAVPYLRSGRLRQVLQDWTLPSANIMAVYPTRQNLSARTRTFVAGLTDWFAAQRVITSLEDSKW